MSIVILVIGCMAIMAGAAMVAFGIPVSEFSFGNTLIVAGTTLATGGLVVIALSAVISRLQRIAQALAARTPVQSRPLETAEPPPEAWTAPATGRIPFPPKPAMREPLTAPPQPADMAGEERPHQSFAPSLRNPEAPPLTVEDDVSLSPHYPLGGASTPGEAGAPARPLPSPTNGSGAFEPSRESAMDEPWRSPPPPREAPSGYFDNMWPAKPSPAAGEPRGEPKRPSPQESAARKAAPEPGAVSQPRTVAILKSGVVDGMGYTLYVDGSIEAELPQGTLRFASIDELRSHLEKSS